MNNFIMNDIPRSLEQKVEDVLSAGEIIEAKMKGAHKEALFCTDRRIVIVKSGFMTGSTFGISLFQIAYSNVASVDVKFNLLSGYFEVSAGGMQNTTKSYWSSSNEKSASKAPNCVALLGRDQKANFQNVCTLIMENVHRSKNEGASKSLSIAEGLVKIAELYEKGLLTEGEFIDQKAKLIGSGANTAQRVKPVATAEPAQEEHPLSPRLEAALQREANRIHLEQAFPPPSIPPTFGRRGVRPLA